MSIPDNYKALPGFKVTYSEESLRLAIAICESFILNNLGGGGGGGSGGGDASSANQLIEIAALNNINNKLPSSLTTTSGRLQVNQDIKPISGTTQNLVLTTTATQFSISVTNCIAYAFKSTQSSNFTYAFAAGVVTTAAAYTVLSGNEDSDNFNCYSYTGLIYFSGTVANQNIEIKTWSLV